MDLYDSDQWQTQWYPSSAIWLCHSHNNWERNRLRLQLFATCVIFRCVASNVISHQFPLKRRSPAYCWGTRPPQQTWRYPFACNSIFIVPNHVVSLSFGRSLKQSELGYKQFYTASCCISVKTGCLHEMFMFQTGDANLADHYVILIAVTRSDTTSIGLKYFTTSRLQEHRLLITVIPSHGVPDATIIPNARNAEHSEGTKIQLSWTCLLSLRRANDDAKLPLSHKP
jgi:hypothetical protein